MAKNLLCNLLYMLILNIIDDKIVQNFTVYSRFTHLTRSFKIATRAPAQHPPKACAIGPSL